MVVRLWLLLGKVVVLVVVVLSSLLVISPSIASCIVFVVHQTEQVLYDLSQVRLTRQIVPLEAAFEHGLVLLEVCLVKCFFSLDFSHFFNFVMVYKHNFVVEGLFVQALFGVGGAVGLLVAYEGKGAAIFCLLKPDVLDVAKLAKKIVQLSVAPVSWKVSNI